MFLLGPTHKKLEVIEKTTYLFISIFNLFSVAVGRVDSVPDSKVIDICSSRLIASSQLLAVS